MTNRDHAGTFARLLTGEALNGELTRISHHLDSEPLRWAN